MIQLVREIGLDRAHELIAEHVGYPDEEGEEQKEQQQEEEPAIDEAEQQIAQPMQRMAIRSTVDSRHAALEAMIMNCDHEFENGACVKCPLMEPQFSYAPEPDIRECGTCNAEMDGDTCSSCGQGS